MKDINTEQNLSWNTFIFSLQLAVSTYCDMLFAITIKNEKQKINKLTKTINILKWHNCEAEAILYRYVVTHLMKVPCLHLNMQPTDPGLQRWLLYQQIHHHCFWLMGCTRVFYNILFHQNEIFCYVQERKQQVTGLINILLLQYTQCCIQ